MIIRIDDTSPDVLGGTIEMHDLPNGGVAVLDVSDKMVCYNKNGKPTGNDWDYVRKDFRMGVDKADK